MILSNYLKRGLKFIITGVPEKNITANVTYISPSEELKGKKIIITGGGRGLGYAMAKCFVSCGAEVLIAGRNETTLREAAKTLGCKCLKLDMRDTASFDTFIEAADKLVGGVNCLVNNAGISLHETGFLAVSEEQFDAQFDTNLKGPFFLTQSFIRLWKTKEEHSGKVLFVSSETGSTVDERPYGLTKAAVNSLVQGLAYRYISDGVRINAIAPGITASDMTGLQADGNLYYPANITERVYLPDEVAEVAKFMLSDASNLLNGQILVCNEGKTINARWK